MFDFRMLGTTALTHDDGTSVESVLAQPKRLGLLAYLVLHHPGEFVRRDHLIALFWPERDESRARNALRQSLHFLRRSLGPRAIQSRGDGEVALAREQFRVDVWDLEEGETTAVLERLYKGELLEGLHLDGCPGFAEWLDQERHRIRGRLWERARRLAARSGTEGAGEEVLTAARLAVSLRPLDEASARRLMELLLGRGDRPGAEEEFERLESALDSAFGVRPSPETAALRIRIQEEDARPFSVPTGPSLAPSPTGPETGLLAGAPSLLATGSPSPEPTHAKLGRLLPFLALALVPWALYSAADSSREAPSPHGPTGEPVAGGWVLVEGDTPPEAATVGRALIELFRVDLPRRTVAGVYSPARVGDGLRRMRLDPEAALTPTMAAELARRDGLPGIVRLTARPSGDGYLLLAEAVGRDGSPVGQARAMAPGRPDLIPALEQISESIAAVLDAHSDEDARPLPQATSASLEALELYALAREGGPTDHLERATQIDSTFAMAWLERGRRLRHDPRLAAPLMRRAWGLRDDVSRAERYDIEYTYHELLTGDDSAALAASDAFISVRPWAESLWLRQQIILAYRAREWQEVVRLSERKRQVDGGYPLPDWWNLIAAQSMLRDYASLQATLEEAPSEAERLRADFRIAFQRQEWDEATTLTRRAAAQVDGEWPNGPLWEAMVHLGAGRIASAREEMERSHTLAVALDQPEPGVNNFAWFALAHLHLLADTATALEYLTRAGEHTARRDRTSILRMAWAWADAGRVDLAKSHLAAWEVAMAVHDIPRRRMPREWWVARSAIALAEGRAADAAAIAEEAVREPVGWPFDCMFCPDILLARALDELGRHEQAAEHYRTAADAQYLMGLDRHMDVALLVPVRVRLAELYEAAGKEDEAAEQYREIIHQWSDADEVLQPRVSAARAALERLSRR